MEERIKGWEGFRKNKIAMQQTHEHKRPAEQNIHTHIFSQIEVLSWSFLFLMISQKVTLWILANLGKVNDETMSIGQSN